MQNADPSSDRALEYAKPHLARVERRKAPRNRPPYPWLLILAATVGIYSPVTLSGAGLLVHRSPETWSWLLVPVGWLLLVSVPAVFVAGVVGLTLNFERGRETVSYVFAGVGTLLSGFGSMFCLMLLLTGID
ncbi:MAG: hypothetical protein AAF656_13375 [Planctomycetota bacterium]